MNRPPEEVQIYHITDLDNLPSILSERGLYSDVAMVGRPHAVIGYSHIKERRMTQIRVDCCDRRLVGEFVPFYYCPRSPMLYTLNRGNVERPPGCQKTILHLVSTVAVGINLGRPWAISDGNAGSSYATFSSDLSALENLDWDAIRARLWRDRINEKAAEFLVADFFPWTGFHQVGCFNSTIANTVKDMIGKESHCPEVTVQPGWYYES